MDVPIGRIGWFGTLRVPPHLTVHCWTIVFPVSVVVGRLGTPKRKVTISVSSAPCAADH